MDQRVRMTQDIDLLLANATILEREGLVEEAKHSYRKILLYQPDHGKARQEYQRILDNELAQILQSEPDRTSVSHFPHRSVNTLLTKLESDLKLGTSQTLSGKNSISLEALIPHLRTQDKMDLGTALLEMELWENADTLLTAPGTDLGLLFLSVVCLYQQGRLEEATSKSLAALSLATDSIDNQCTFLYLLGFLAEARGDTKTAKTYYQKVFLLNPKYREARERMG